MAPKRGRGDAFAERGNHAAGDENESIHDGSPPIKRLPSARIKADESNEAKRNNGNSTGVQVSRSTRPRQSNYITRAGIVPRDSKPRRVRGRAPARIQPQIADGDQFIAREHQRQRVPHPWQHAERLTQVLHGLRFGRARGLEVSPPSRRRTISAVGQPLAQRCRRFARSSVKFPSPAPARSTIPSAPAQAAHPARRGGSASVRNNRLPIAPQRMIAPHDCRLMIGLRIEYLPQRLAQGARWTALPRPA